MNTAINIQTPAIEAQHLARSFGATKAVVDVSLQVAPGSIFGLLGPNGAGKTTTVRLLSGQIEPHAGTARVGSCDIVKEHQRLKEVIGVVFEDQNLYERLSARLNLEFSCWLYNLPATRVDEVLTLVGLRERAKEPVRTFSNGMRQRLMIARALLHRPKVLFLDEPGRGLDPVAAHKIHQTIQQLSQEGMTILLTTHIMEEADQLCEKIAFIIHGTIVACDTPRNLKLAHGKRAMTVTLKQPSAHSEGYQFDEKVLRLDDSDDQQLLMCWLREGRVQAIHTAEATLEEIFFEIAGVPLA